MNRLDVYFRTRNNSNFQALAEHQETNVTFLSFDRWRNIYILNNILLVQNCANKLCKFIHKSLHNYINLFLLIVYSVYLQLL